MISSRIVRVLQATAGMAVLAAAWQILSMMLPPFLFPPVPEIVKRTVEILITGSLLWDVVLTGLRIFGGLFGAFFLGCLLALLVRTLEDGGKLRRPGAHIFPGHSGAVLGGVRHHLVPGHRIPRAVSSW